MSARKSSEVPYRFGIEEEYFLADAETRGTPRRSVKTVPCRGRRAPAEIGRELLQCQVEVCTPPSTEFPEAHAALLKQRRQLAEIGAEHGLLVFAAGTHPIADWARQADQGRPLSRHPARCRPCGRRSLICGMHVHVEVADPGPASG